MPFWNVQVNHAYCNHFWMMTVTFHLNSFTVRKLKTLSGVIWWDQKSWWFSAKLICLSYSLTYLTSMLYSFCGRNLRVYMMWLKKCKTMDKWLYQDLPNKTRYFVHAHFSNACGRISAEVWKLSDIYSARNKEIEWHDNNSIRKKH